MINFNFRRIAFASAASLSFLFNSGSLAENIPASKEEVARIESRISSELRKVDDFSISPAYDDYWTAVLTWRYFDFDKAAEYVNGLIASKKIRRQDKNKMIRALRKWPFIKHHAMECEKADPRMVYWMFMTETGMDYTVKGRYGERTDGQIMKATGDRYQKYWSKDKCWIKGEDWTHPLNCLIGASQHFYGQMAAAKCRHKCLEELTASEIWKSYAGYAGNRRHLYKRDLEDGVWLTNWICNTYNLSYLKYVDQSAGGRFMTEEGRNKLAEIRGKLKLACLK